jgi:hypothetical protein
MTNQPRRFAWLLRVTDARAERHFWGHLQFSILHIRLQQSRDKSPLPLHFPTIVRKLLSSNQLQTKCAFLKIFARFGLLVTY